MLRRVLDQMAALRREQADLFLELSDRLDRLEQARAASPPNAAAETLLAAIAPQFGEREFLALELLDWCRPCTAQPQRDAYRALCELCKDTDPTSLQAGLALRALVLAQPPGPWRVERSGERRKTALWRLLRE